LIRNNSDETLRLLNIGKQIGFW